MKMKQWIGLLLALVMVLGLFPATALAEGDTISALPEGYSPMYYQFTTGKYGADIEVNINSRTALVDNLFADSNGSTKLDVTTFSFSFSETNLGNVVDGGRCWDTNSNAVAGTSGYLYAINDTQKYAIPVAIRADTSTEGSGDNEGDSSGNTGTEDTPSIETTITIDGKEYVRLYRAIIDDDSNVNYFDTAQCAAGGDTGLKLCYYDGSQYVFINNTDYECTYVYGDLDWNNKNTEFVWQPRITGVGKTGYIFATKGDEKYAFPVTVSNPEFGVYTQIPNTQDLTQNYIEGNSGNYTVPYDMEKGTTVHIYWAAGISACTNQTSGVAVEIKDPSSDDSNLTDTNIISVSLPASDKISSTVSLSITNKQANRTNNIEINFQSPTAPGGKPWMYDGDGNANISQPAGGGCDIQLKFKNQDGTYTFITGTENGDNKTISCEEAFGQFVWVSSHSAWNWQTGTAIPGTTGYIYATVGTGDTATTYAIAAEVTAAEVGVYTNEIDKNDISKGYVPNTNGQYKIDYSKTGRVVYFYTGMDGCDFTFGDFTPNSDVTISKVSDTVLKIELPETSTGNISTRVEFIIVAGGNNNSWGYNLFFTDGTEEDSDDNQGGLPEVSLIEAAHTLKNNEKYPEDTFVEHMGAFTLDGDPNTYYMVPSNRNSPYPHLNGDSTSYEAQMRLMYIEFWVGLGQDNYSRVTDSATLNKIKAAFSDTNGNCTLTMDLKATVYYQSPLPTDYPAIYTTPDVDAWRQPITAKFDFGSAGTWLYCASGKIGDQTITSLVRSKIGFGGDIIWTPDTGTEVDVITQVNTYLNTVELPDNFGLIVNLPAGNYSGYITVPSRLSDDGISINGVYDEINGVFSTILNGGVQGENRRTHVTGIHFIGAGENVKEWDKNTVNSGRPNYAYYGSCGGNFGECLFENYDCAVMSSYEIKTGTNSWFKNNHTAVCYNTTEFAGIGVSLKDNLYEDNEIGIHFAQFNNRVGLTILGISGSCFVDNKTDIRNDIKRNIYVPGNYFAYTNNGIEKIRECQYLPQANGNKDKIVHYYPQSANRQFDAWIYDMSFYKHDPVVSANLAATYKIPAEYLTKSVTVMNEDETLAVWTFGKTEEE